jgi:hypothetical protein
MLLDWETTPRTVTSRLRRIAQGYRLSEPPHVLYRQMLRPLADQVDVLRADRDRLGIDLFLFDSLSFAARRLAQRPSRCVEFTLGVCIWRTWYART